MSEARRRRRVEEKSRKSSPREPIRQAIPEVSVTSIFSGRALLITLSLIAANLIVYFPVRHFDFVTLDDPEYVSDNPCVLGGITSRCVAWAFTTGHISNWHPLTWLSLMLDVSLFGPNAGPIHMMNVLFHTLNTILLFGVLRAMTGAIPGALGRSAFVAGLFAVHPLHVESVAWIGERKDVLSTLFGLLTLWAYLEYTRRPNKARWGHYALVMVFFALGLMAKPMLVTLPFVLLLLDYWPLKRAEEGSGSRAAWFKLVREKLPLLALAAGSSISTYIVQQQGGSVTSLAASPLSLRIANALVSYVAYIGQMFWPMRLTVFYPYPATLPAWQVAGSLAILAAISTVIIRAGRRHPYLPVGWLWYLGTLLPVIGLVRVGEQARADRYTYVPMIGLFILIAWAVPELAGRWAHRWAQRWTHRGAALAVAAAVVLIVCAGIARRQVQYWKNSVTLWEHAIQITGDNSVAQYGLGEALNNQGNAAQALAHYSEAVRIKPNAAEARVNLGIVLRDQGKLAEAIEQYRAALRLKPGLAEAHNNLGDALAQQGKIDEALQEFLEAVRLQPDYVDAHYNAAVMLEQKGDVASARLHYESALQADPNRAVIRSALDRLGPKP